MYRLADIDFSNVLDISRKEPLSDEIDRQGWTKTCGVSLSSRPAKS